MKQTVLLASLRTAAAAPLAAQTAIGLSGDKTLTMIDLGTGAVTGRQDVMVEGGLLGIDYRPNTDTLIGVTDAFEVVNIDAATDAMGGNTAWLAANGVLHTVSLDSGVVAESWMIDGMDVTLRDMTVIAGGM